MHLRDGDAVVGDGHARRRGPRKPVNPAENQTANEPQETVAAPESPAVVDVLGVEE